MTDTKRNLCRVIAEQMISEDCNLRYRPFRLSGSKIEYEKLCGSLTGLIRNHTIVPEMVELCHYAAKIKKYGQLTHLIARATAILAKLEGRKP